MKFIFSLISVILPQIALAGYKIQIPEVSDNDNFVKLDGDYTQATIDYIVALGNNILLLVAGLAVLGITIGGVQMLIHMGNDDGVSQAKKTITYSLIGLTVSVLAWVIINTVVVAIVGIVA